MDLDYPSLIGLIHARGAAFRRPSHDPVTAILHLRRRTRLTRLVVDLKCYRDLRHAEADPRFEHWCEQAEARIRDGVAWLRAA